MKNKILYLFILFIFFGFIMNCSKKNDESKTSIKFEEEPKKEAAATQEKTLVFGRVPGDNVKIVLKQMNPLKHYLEKKLNAKIVIKFANDYEKVIENLKDKYHFAILGPVAYVKATELFECKPLVKPIRRGKPTYEGIIIVHTDSGINKVTDLKGKKIAFVDPDSTSGYIFPLYVLNKAGLKEDIDFKYAFLNGHDNVVLNVLKKRYDAGACYNDARTVALKNNLSQIDQLKIIATTPPISTDPIAAGPKLIHDGDWFEKVKKAFIELENDPEKESIFEALTGEINGYSPAEDSDYNVIREFLKKEKTK